MPPVNGKVIKSRAKALREEGQRVKSAHLESRIGDIDTALFEAGGLGRLPDFTLVKVDNPPKAGQLARVKLISHDGEFAAAIIQ